MSSVKFRKSAWFILDSSENRARISTRSDRPPIDQRVRATIDKSRSHADMADRQEFNLIPGKQIGMSRAEIEIEGSSGLGSFVYSKNL